MMEMDDRSSSPLSPLDSQEEEEFDETEDESDISKTESDPDEQYPASSRPKSTTAILQSRPLPHLQQPPSPVFEKDVKAERAQARRSNKTSVSELVDDLGGLNLAGEKTRQGAAQTTGTRRSRKVSAAEDEDEDSIIVVQNAKGGEGQKKKKR
jgi:hypothetical protein